MIKSDVFNGRILTHCMCPPEYTERSYYPQ